jgi:hypothetical protein
MDWFNGRNIMNRGLNFKSLTVTFFIAGFASYILCIAGDLLFGWTMYLVWAPLLPGFAWPLSISGFLIGLVWLALYSIYTAALIVFPYNFFIQRESVRHAT